MTIEMTARQEAMLKAIQKKPFATLAEFKRMTGIPTTSGIWYNIHVLEKRGLPLKGVTWAQVIASLKKQGKLLRIEGAKLRLKSTRAKKRDEPSRIEAVVAKARAVQLGGNIDKARLVVEWSGGDKYHGEWIASQGGKTWTR